jgi:putative FmdB family regulatory protein
MPTYEYQCGACDHEFEREQRITEDPVRICPSCKARKARRLISRTSFVLKGSGWYSDLYSSPGSKPDAQKEGSDKSEDKSKNEDKSSSEPSEKSKPAKDKSSKDKPTKSKSDKGKSRPAA